MDRKWLAGVAAATIAGLLPACSGALDGLTPAKQPDASASAGKAAGGTDSATSTETTFGADDQETVPISDEFAELEALLKALADPEVLELIGADPLINDGGAVFLDDSAAGSYRVASMHPHKPGDKPPLWKRLNLKPVGGKFDDGIRCSDPAKLGDDTPAGFRSLCFDKAAGMADVTVAQRVRGRFIIDVPPYTTMPFKGILLGHDRASWGDKEMDLLAVTRTKFRRNRTRWQVQGASTTQMRMVKEASQSVRITSVDLVSDNLSLLGVQSPAHVIAKRDFKRMPRAKQVVVRAKINAPEGAVVFLEDARNGIKRLFDDGTSLHGDETAGDGVYSNRLNTPAVQQLVHRMAVHAYSPAMMSNEDKDDYDGDTWIIPMRVD